MGTVAEVAAAEAEAEAEAEEEAAEAAGVHHLQSIPKEKIKSL